jgi:hypothetical protein
MARHVSVFNAGDGSVLVLRVRCHAQRLKRDGGGFLV